MENQPKCPHRSITIRPTAGESITSARLGRVWLTPGTWSACPVVMTWWSTCPANLPSCSSRQAL